MNNEINTEKGGTQMFCPFCKDIRECRTFTLTEIGHKEGQRMFHTKYPDLEWFKRGRDCLTCNNHFETAEIQESKLFELVKLRDMLTEITVDADIFNMDAPVDEHLDSLSNYIKAIRNLSLPWEK